MVTIRDYVKETLEELNNFQKSILWVVILGYFIANLLEKLAINIRILSWSIVFGSISRARYHINKIQKNN